MKNKRYFCILWIGFLIIPVQAGWKTKTKKEKKLQELKMETSQAREALLKRDPELNTYFEDAYAYIIFPSVKKGASGIGGALGKGLVFQEKQAIGYAKLRQLSIGFQLGGQAYIEVVFFKDEISFRRFQTGKIELGAQASAVAIKKGASKSGVYNDGLAIFTMTKVGLMYEASVGGQKLKFEPF